MERAQRIGVKGRITFEEFEHLADGRHRLVKRWEAKNLITTVGLAWLAGALSGDTASPNTMKYIAIGTDNDPVPATGQTALNAEVETRATGTISRVTTTLANDTFRAVGTITMGSSRTLIEAGLFDQAALGGNMGSRSIFSAETVGSGNDLQITYEWQFEDAS